MSSEDEEDVAALVASLALIQRKKWEEMKKREEIYLYAHRL